MSGRLVKDVLQYAPTDLTDKERLVLIALAEDARDRDRIARFIKLEHIADYARISTGTARNILSRLTNRALIQPTISHANKGRRQQYRIALLTPSHRDATIRKASSSEMTHNSPEPDPKASPQRMRLTPVDNSGPDLQSVIQMPSKRHQAG
jgi:hypothetical protein